MTVTATTGDWVQGKSSATGPPIAAARAANHAQTGDITTPKTSGVDQMHHNRRPP